MALITAERLRELVYYDPETGVFSWRAYRRGQRKDGIVGGPDTKGYTRMQVEGRNYRAHQLAWLYMTGEWRQVDHRDLNKRNNRYDNLRPASNSANGANRPRLANNSSGFKGVCFHKHTRKWVAQITHHRSVHHIGYFPTPEEAHAAYAAAAKVFHGEFARAA